METPLKKLTSEEREQLNAHATITPLTTSNLIISMSTEVSLGNLILSGKNVEIVQFKGGNNALIIDGVLYKFEIMTYHYDEATDTDTNLTMTDIGIDVGSDDGAEIEELDDEE